MSGDPLFIEYDLLVLHLDADVAAEDPATYRVNPIPSLKGVLPCEQPCPPPEDTTNRLRRVLLSWVGETETPPRTVLCTPSKSIEAWVLAIFFPNDRELKRRGWECHPKPGNRLGQQRKGVRFPKTRAAYEARAPTIQARWQNIAVKLSEARRFQADFEAAVSQQ